jgi:hypothetical protein
MLIAAGYLSRCLCLGCSFNGYGGCVMHVMPMIICIRLALQLRSLELLMTMWGNSGTPTQVPWEL